MDLWGKNGYLWYSEEVGLFYATVSSVINKSANVSDKARKIIEEIIAESGYKPNRIARSLAKNSTQMIGIMVPDIRGVFWESVGLWTWKEAWQARLYQPTLHDNK